LRHGALDLEFLTFRVFSNQQLSSGVVLLIGIAQIAVGLYFNRFSHFESIAAVGALHIVIACVSLFVVRCNTARSAGYFYGFMVLMTLVLIVLQIAGFCLNLIECREEHCQMSALEMIIISVSMFSFTLICCPMWVACSRK
jgi:hypothetical protein